MGKTTRHLIKLAVGCASLEELRQRQKPWLHDRADGCRVYRHRTRFMPKDADAVKAGGSMYWIIKGQVLARQTVVDFETVDAGEDSHCLIHLGPNVTPVLPTPRRPHQGWRYLAPEDAPPDTGTADSGTADSGVANSGAAGGDGEAMPAAMAQQLRALALL